MVTECGVLACCDVSDMPHSVSSGNVRVTEVWAATPTVGGLSSTFSINNSCKYSILRRPYFATNN